VRLAERETAAYALLAGIDYVIEECPMVEGNTQHRYKEAITLIEEASPGTKHQMYFGFLKRAADRFAGDATSGDLVACISCGAPTIGSEQGEAHCAFCKTKSLAHKRAVEGVPPPRRPRRRKRH
jgi:tRNA(Ile)-lysidine synthase TilS/MesJ